MPSAVSNTTVRLVLLKHKARADGTCPVAVRATTDRKSRYKTTGVRVRPKDWNPKRGEVRASHEIADALSAKLPAVLHEAEALALDRSSADAVKAALGGGGSATGYFERFVADLDAAGKFWEWKKYRGTLGKLRAALGRDEVPWGDLDPAALARFERHCRVTLKNAPNTVRKELTRLHRVVKQAVRDGEIKPADDPFLVYEWPQRSKVNRRKLTSDEVARIRDLGPADSVVNGSADALARDCFAFSFYAGGMRFSDVARLKASDVRDGRVSYVMLKTGTAVSVPVPPPALAIAARYVEGADERGGFLFPMLRPDDEADGVRLRRRISSWNARVNAALKTLAPKANLAPEGLSMHVARHSYADHCRRVSGDLYAISKSLGHSNLQTTETYLKSFDRDAVDRLAGEVWGEE